MTKIYETLLCQDGKIEYFNEHFARLQKSAKALNLTIPYTKYQLLKKVQIPTGKNRLRIELSNNKLSYIFSKFDPITSSKLVSYKAERPNPKHKLSDRSIENKALDYAHKNQAIDAILVDNLGNYTEGSISNFFIVTNNCVITPSRNILKGIIRNKIIQQCKKNSIKIKFQNIKVSDIQKADEIFISNSLKKIVPISKIDDYDKLRFPGPITQFLCEKLT